MSITVLDANEILPKTEEDSLPLSDLFRFTLLSKIEKCVWLDTDIFLLKRLSDGNFVSSEHSNRTGAFRTKDRTKTANIGCISQTEKIIDWQKIIEKCKKSNSKQNSNCNNYMKIYQKEIHNNHWDIIAEPNAFCPISWCYAKEIYTEPDIIGTKFGIAQKNLEWILENSTSVHLWRNLFRKNKYEIKENSVYNKLKELVTTQYKICIPSYNRLKGIQDKTLKLLKKNDITNIYIFVSTQKDFEEYSEAKIGNIVLVPEEYSGIGAVRSFIVNEWAEDGDDLVFYDDDIEDVKNLYGGSVDLLDFHDEFHSNLKALNLFFGGLPLCSNPYFMKDSWTRSLKYISGAIQFIRVDKSREKIECFRRMYEDYCYDIMFFKRDGGILRYNGAAPQTKNYNPEGGIADEMGGMEKRLECEHIADEIIDRFGNKVVSKYYKKKSARGPACFNLKLNWRCKPSDIL
tara:strand:+ start:605 stop:1981 length:1377 start_codon:yes stop_codon:yes gene_type:complete